jgi:hypothetical protein
MHISVQSSLLRNPELVKKNVRYRTVHGLGAAVPSVTRILKKVFLLKRQ